MIIQFDGFNKNFLILLFMGFSYFIKVFSVSFQTKIDKNINDFNYQEHPLYYIFLMYIGEALIGLLYFIQKKESGSERISSLFRNQKLTSKLKLIFLPLIPCLLDGCLSLLSSVLLNFNYLSLELLNKLVMIFLNSIITRFFFKKLFYKHHFLGIVIITCSTIGITIIQMISTSSLLINPNQWFFILLAIFISILCAIQDSFEKYSMIKNYYTPLSLITLEGIYGTVLTIILIGILSLIKGNVGVFCATNTKDYCENIFLLLKLFAITKGRLFVTLSMIISFLIFNTLRLKIIYNLSTAHRSLSDSFGGFLIWVFLMNIFGEEEISVFNFIVGFVSYLFIIIGVMIFMEIIILNCYGLNKNISNTIQKRDVENVANLRSELNDTITNLDNVEVDQINTSLAFL